MKRQRFRKALEIDSFNAAVYYNRGVTWFDKGNLQQALADIGKALNLKPEDQRNKRAETLLETRFKNLKIEQIDHEKERGSKNHRAAEPPDSDRWPA